ncbi:MAG TPA: hypothetical protein VFG83_10445 [Kofleriaceae bacterium]|nr:hypothetical protein [Kofleriaceae bacterium]
MLDPWIIEEIRRREDDRRQHEHGRLEVPLEAPHYREPESPKPPEEDADRGVVIIDL